MQLHVSGRLDVDVHSDRSVVDFLSGFVDTRLPRHRRRLYEVVQRQVPVPFVVHLGSQNVRRQVVLAVEPLVGKRLGVLDVVFVEVAPKETGFSKPI